jgi:CRP-like cAMP-binding protein
MTRTNVRSQPMNGVNANHTHAPHQLLKFDRKRALYHHGDTATTVYRVRSGLVRITRMTPEGRIMTVRHVLPGDYFGEEAFTGESREEMAEALTETELEAYEHAGLTGSILMDITRSLSHQMQRLVDYEYHLQTGDLRQRVARYLLTLAETPLAFENDEGITTVSATHELLAEGTASTRESVSKIITQLRVEGLIRTAYRSIKLIEPDILDDIANDL